MTSVVPLIGGDMGESVTAILLGVINLEKNQSHIDTLIGVK